MRITEDARRDLDRMQGQRAPTADGGSVPLGVVADVALASGPSTIERYDRRTRVTIKADFGPGAVLGPAVEAVHALPEATAMEGAELQTAGDAEIMGEVFASFGQAMGAGLLLVYVVLFRSFVTPFTILLSLPLAMGGAIFALFVTSNAISLPVVIGFLMLKGIVTKNAIMLVEFALEAIDAGADRAAAMLGAGHKRARPIVMTTIAMTAGMVPSALALGAGGEFRAPMAIAVIGGLLLSTLLSLVFVPSLFTFIDAGRKRSTRRLTRLLGLNRPAAPAGEAAE